MVDAFVMLRSACGLAKAAKEQRWESSIITKPGKHSSGQMRMLATTMNVQTWIVAHLVSASENLESCADCASVANVGYVALIDLTYNSDFSI